MDSLQEILGNKKFEKPDEMTVIKEYVKRKYKSPCKVKVQRGALILTVPNSALAATLHLEQRALIRACHIAQYKLVIRTGN